MSRAPTLALAAVLALAGCGGGGGGSASTASAPPQSGATTQSSSAGHDGAAKSQPPHSTAQKGQEHPSPAELPPPTPGSKAAAPGVPTSPEGDNSIQTWGLEASDAEREAATKAVQAYLDARAAGDWAKVCSYLAAKPRAEQSRFGGGASCAQAMESFAADAQTSVLEEEAEIEVLSFRVGRKYAFLIYRRPDGVFATALSREDGRWKLFSVTPNPLS